jgi:hypothetical protein
MRTGQLRFPFLPFSLALCAGIASVGISSGSLRATTSTEPRPDTASFQEQAIGEMTPGSEFKGAVAGKEHLAWVEHMGGKRTVRLDGKQQGGAYDDVRYPNFNAEASHLVFFGKRNGKWVFVLDGQEQPAEYSKIATVDFQRDGSSYAFCACNDKKCSLVVDGKEAGGAYTDISSPEYSRDGKHLGYFGKKGKKWVSIVDGKEEGPELDELWHPESGFSGEGNHFYTAARIKNTWLYVIDGQQGPDFMVLSPINFSKDGKHYAYGGTTVKGGIKKQKTLGTIVLDGKPVGTYEGRGMTGAWIALAGNTETIVEGVRDLVPDFHGVSTPELDSLGRLVYAARRDKGDVAVFVGANAGPGFEEILSPIAFSEDSQHFAYVAKDGDNFVEVRDNVPGRSFTSSRHHASDVPWIFLSSDTKHLAYQTVSGGKQYTTGGTRRALRSVVIDNRDGPEYNALNISPFGFTKDGDHYFYRVQGAKGDQDLVNADGHESRLYDLITGARIDVEAKTFSFVARDGSRFMRVTFDFH